MTQSDFRESWLVSAKKKGIPPEFYRGIKVRFLGDPSGRSKYTMGVVFNPGRYQRPGAEAQKTVCHMCRIVEEVRGDPSVALFQNEGISGNVISPNEFPPTEGAVLVISEEERPMYNTNDLGSLGDGGEALRELFAFGRKNNLMMYHQTKGAGATIDRHEHWHGTTLYELQRAAGRKFGFDAAEVEQVGRVSGVYTSPEFPFAHLVFDEADPARIVHFLRRIGNELPSPLDDGSIPHTLSQGEQGILIAPVRIDVGKSMGSERAPGYFFVPTEEAYDSTTYESATRFMEDRFFPTSVGLEKFL